MPRALRTNASTTARSAAASPACVSIPSTTNTPIRVIASCSPSGTPSAARCHRRIVSTCP
ncbi:hypothetical protein ACFQV2_10865 [Actinokineospora soli]|uniref:Uncharacterized protein n=1 Tax=Actinokineospora soli TaxID=1048753 RepID=A0ABW2TN73_9PSEU